MISRESVARSMDPESVDMRAKASEKPGSIVGYDITFRICRVNFAGMSITTDKALVRGIPSEQRHE